MLNLRIPPNMPRLLPFLNSALKWRCLGICLLLRCFPIGIRRSFMNKTPMLPSVRESTVALEVTPVSFPPAAGTKPLSTLWFLSCVYFGFVLTGTWAHWVQWEAFTYREHTKPITDGTQLKTHYSLGWDFWLYLKASLDCLGWNSEDTHLKIICAPVLLECDRRTSHCFCVEENVVGDSGLWLCVTWDPTAHDQESAWGQLMLLPETRVCKRLLTCKH